MSLFLEPDVSLETIVCRHVVNMVVCFYLTKFNFHVLIFAFGCHFSIVLLILMASESLLLVF